MDGKIKLLFLHNVHKALGAEMQPFCGFIMPLYYTGVLDEHRAVRQTAGIFDVSHMTHIEVIGEKSADFLDFLTTNVLKSVKNGTATYTLFPNEKGGVIDDAIIYKKSDTDFFVVANACKRERLLHHFKSYALLYPGISFKEVRGIILALQGPKSPQIIENIFSITPPPHHTFIEIKNPLFGSLIIAATGYTGEIGFEIFATPVYGEALFSSLVKAVTMTGGMVAGLGARDLLRLEMGFPLSGADWTEDTPVTETFSSFAVRMDKDRFLGKDMLLRHPQKYFPCALILDEVKYLVRAGAPIFKNGQHIGKVTSGNISPSLNRPIALGFTDISLKPGEKVEIERRGIKVPAEVTKVPFIKKRKLHETL